MRLVLVFLLLSLILAGGSVYAGESLPVPEPGTIPAPPIEPFPPKTSYLPIVFSGGECGVWFFNCYVH